MAQPVQTNAKAIASVILGIFSFILLPFAWISGPATLILAIMARREIAASTGAQSGSGLALAGLVMGWVLVGLLLLSILFLIALVNTTGGIVHFGR